MFRRTYGTARKALTHAHYDLHPWPKSGNPSPHDLFCTSRVPKNGLKQHVRLTYKKYLKLYHPDLASSNDVLSDTGEVLLSKEKRERFNVIKDAYERLTAPQQAASMPQYRQSSTSYTSSTNNYSGSTSSFGGSSWNAENTYSDPGAHYASRSNSFRRQFYKDEAFWQAGTWEEYYRMKYQKEPPTKEQIEANKWKILKWVASFTVVYCALQLLLAMERAKEYNRQIHLQNLQANSHLTNSYTNHGDEDLSQEGRLKRFLVHRSLSLSEEDRKGANEELWMKYAQMSRNGKVSNDFLGSNQSHELELVPIDAPLALPPPQETKW